MSKYKLVVYNFIKEQASIIYSFKKKRILKLLNGFLIPPHGTVNIKDFADVKYLQHDTYGLGEDIYQSVYKNSYSIFLEMHQQRYKKNQNTIYDTQRDFNNQFGQCTFY